MILSIAVLKYSIADLAKVRGASAAAMVKVFEQGDPNTAVCARPVSSF
jgi:hypothetical protein